MSFVGRHPPTVAPPALSRFGSRPRPALPEPTIDQPSRCRVRKTPEISRDSLFASLIGTEISAEKFLEMADRRALLADQTEAQAEALDRYGERCRAVVVADLDNVIEAFDPWSPVRPILEILANDLESIPLHRWNGRSRDAQRSIDDLSIYMSAANQAKIYEIESILELLHSERLPPVGDVFWKIEDISQYIVNLIGHDPSIYGPLHDCEALVFERPDGHAPPWFWSDFGPAALARGQAAYRRVLATAAEIFQTALTRLRSEPERRRAETKKILRESGIFRSIQKIPYGHRAASGLARVDLITGHVDVVPALRDLRMLPSVGQSQRKSILSQLEIFLETADVPRDPTGKSYCRYGVVTSGERVPLGGDLDGRLTDHIRSISKWAHEIFKRFKIIVMMRATEFTINKSGVHPHSNVLYYQTTKLTPELFNSFLTFTRKYFGTAWQDCGRIGNVQEIVKYAIKPADVAAIMEDPEIDGDAVIGWLYESTLRH